MPVKLYAVIDMNVLVLALFARDPKSNYYCPLKLFDSTKN